MIAAVDAAYADTHAFAAVVAFADWSAGSVAEEHVVRVDGIAPYTPGAFFLRELPCALAVLRKLTGAVDVVVVDGYVWLSAERPGYGARLHDALHTRVAVVGVAKTRFKGAAAVEVQRGKSARPLFVTAAGIDVARAAAGVRAMDGAARIPSMIARADRLCRDALSSG